MAMTVRYETFAGELISENRGGTETFYTSDTLGSVIECRDDTGTKTYSAEYWAYGEVRTSTGSNPSPWFFVGTLGYHGVNFTGTYVRARYLRSSLARWMTVDPLWPRQSQYVYADGIPVTLVDRTGQKPNKWHQRDPYRGGKCTVKVCSMYGFADDPRWFGDPWLVTHQYVCAVKANGQECKFGLGGDDRKSPCSDSDKFGFPIRCKTVSSDCWFASVACVCINQVKRNPPEYSIPLSTCWSTKRHVQHCVDYFLREPENELQIRGKFNNLGRSIGPTEGMW